MSQEQGEDASKADYRDLEKLVEVKTLELKALIRAERARIREEVKRLALIVQDADPITYPMELRKEIDDLTNKLA